jgi:hypothetical protein
MVDGTAKVGDTNRRRHKPALSRAGDPPDPKKPHIRLVGRIGWTAPCEVGGTEKGGWHRRWCTACLLNWVDGTDKGGT